MTRKEQKLKNIRSKSRPGTSMTSKAERTGVDHFHKLRRTRKSNNRRKPYSNLHRGDLEITCFSGQGAGNRLRESYRVKSAERAQEIVSKRNNVKYAEFYYNHWDSNKAGGVKLSLTY
jgi:hypothetical protein